MKLHFLTLSLLLLFIPTFGLSQERPETIVIPVSSLGEVSEVRKQILQNTLEDELKSYFRLISQEKYEEVLEKVFEELDYKECNEDQCIVMIQEMLQVENVFHLQVIGEGDDTQLSLSWRTLDEKRKEEEFCEGCKTSDLRRMVDGLVEKLVGVKKIQTDEVIVRKIGQDNRKGMFVTVGDETILTSSNGTTWTERNSWISEELYEVTYGNGLFVTVGDKGTILTSLDENSWTERTSGTSRHLRGVTFGDGLFVTVGRSGTILTSSNGTSWRKRNIETSEWLSGVTYGNGLFVTVGEDGIILTSSNGTHWKERKSGTSRYLYGVTYGNGLFVTVGSWGNILTSSNGTRWKERKSGTSRYLYGVTYGNGRFVISGWEGTILTSSNGTRWKERKSGTSMSLSEITYGNGLFVTVGRSGTILTSLDGNSWTKRNIETSETLYGVTFTQ